MPRLISPVEPSPRVEQRTWTGRCPIRQILARSRRGRFAIWGGCRGGARGGAIVGGRPRVLSLPCPARLGFVNKGSSRSSFDSPALTLPGTYRRTPDANGANLISTLRRALGLNGALGGVGLGPYLLFVRVSKSSKYRTAEGGGDAHCTEDLRSSCLNIRRPCRFRDQSGLQNCSNSCLVSSG